VGAIDDATSRVTGGTFRAAEDADGYFTAFAQTTEQFGLPGGIYSDRHGIFIVERNRIPTLIGQRSLTQVGRALDEDRIAWIGARSPEAEGRIERLWVTLRARLVTELRLAGITTIEAADTFLPGFLIRHNERFAVTAADPISAWRCRPRCHGQRRSWRAQPASATRRSELGRTGGRPRERLDGSLWIRHDGEHYPVAEAPAAPTLLRHAVCRARSRRRRTRGLDRHATDAPPGPPTEPMATRFGPSVAALS
jgi:hypothetical protein